MSKEKVQDYTALADDYDAERYNLDVHHFIDSFRKDVFLGLVNPDKNMDLLDVGTGTGSGVLFFAERVKQLTGLDGTQAMLDIAQKKVESAKMENVRLVCANALEIPFEDNSFDVVTSLNFIHLFVPQGVDFQAKFLDEMARVVKKGGLVVVEFDNALYAKELGNKFSDLSTMSGSLVVEEIKGTYLPKTKMLRSIGEPLARRYGKLAALKPFKPYANKWVVKYRKV